MDSHTAAVDAVDTLRGRRIDDWDIEIEFHKVVTLPLATPRHRHQLTCAV